MNAQHQLVISCPQFNIPMDWIPAIPAGMTAFPACPDLCMTTRVGAWEPQRLYDLVVYGHDDIRRFDYRVGCSAYGQPESFC